MATSLEKSINQADQKFNEEVEKMKVLNKKFQKLVQVSQQLDTQMTENNLVKEELDREVEDAKIYKQMGPILVPFTLTDAKNNVTSRINYIEGETKRNNEEIEKSRKELMTQREVVQKFEHQLMTLISKRNSGT